MNKLLFFFFTFLVSTCSLFCQKTPSFTQPAFLGNLFPTASGLIGLGVDQKNNGVAVWVGTDGINAIIQGATLPVGSNAWIPTNDLSLPGEDASDVQLAVDPQGLAIAIWVRNNVIQGATLDMTKIGPKSVDWVSTHDLSTASSSSPALSINSSGFAIAVWEELPGPTVRASLFVGGNNWVGPQTISNPATPATIPQVFVDPADQAVAVYVQSSQVMASTFDGATWTIHPTPISSPSSMLGGLTIQGDKQGNGIAAWIRETGSNSFQFESASFTKKQNQVAWSSPLVFGTTTIGAELFGSFGLTIDSNTGKGFAIWPTTSNGIDFKLFSSSLSFKSSHWSAPLFVADSALLPVIKMDEQVWAAFSTLDGTQSSEIQVALLNEKETAWNRPKNVSGTEVITVFPTLAIGKDDYAIVAWQNEVMMDLVSVEAVHSIASPPLSPIDLRGQQGTNEFLFQDNIFNKLTWKNPSRGSSPVFYQIFRDAALTQLLGTIPATAPLIFEDQNIKIGMTYSYYVVSLDKAGQRSKPAVVMIRVK